MLKETESTRGTFPENWSKKFDGFESELLSPTNRQNNRNPRRYRAENWGRNGRDGTSLNYPLHFYVIASSNFSLSLFSSLFLVIKFQIPYFLHHFNSILSHRKSDTWRKKNRFFLTLKLQSRCLRGDVPFFVILFGYNKRDFIVIWSWSLWLSWVCEAIVD